MKSTALPSAPDPGLRFDPYREPYLTDPYPFFAEARAATPIFHSATEDCWVLTRHEDMRRVFLNTKQFSASNALAIRPVCPMAGLAFAEANFNSVPTLTVSDPPEHTRIRRLTNLVFTSESVTALEPFIAEYCARFVATHRPRGHAELVRDFAWDLPALLMFKLLGVPDADLPQVTGATVHPKLPLWGRPSETEQIRAAQGIGTFWKYIVRLVADRARAPRGDFVSALFQAQSPGMAPINEAEAASIVFGIMVAGHETTAALVVNGFRQLLAHREAWRAIVAEPALIANAVEEVLRFDSPVIGWRRRTTGPVEIAGVPVPAQATVLMLLGSANRDPAVFAQPEVFDVGRANADRHLSFGLGNHLCLGAPLARTVARATIRHLNAALPSLRLVRDRKTEYSPNLLFRTPLTLETEWDA